MGQEISDSRFSPEHFAEFRLRLADETKLLGEWLKAGHLRSPEPVGGFELEAWLIDSHGLPAPINDAFLKDLDHPLVVPELSTFNVELNSPPLRLDAGVFGLMYEQLKSLWAECEAAAVRQAAHMLMIGVLPTVRQRDLCLANMSSLQRYRALNDQVFRLRQGRPIELHIDGRESMHLEHDDLMLEAAATSLQIHLQVDETQAVKAFNASKLLSAPMVGLSANSPFLFGRSMWDETRIPLFEQAVSVGGSDYSKRVTFGIRYAKDSILECFEANRDRYPVLLPTLMDEPKERLAHLRLHNGTIWRWNRPLVGFSANGEPHLRIEHRVAPSGPTPIDAIANAVFYFGAITALLRSHEELLELASFSEARRNFYAVAAHGLRADVEWRGQRAKLKTVLDEQLMPLVRRGLRLLHLSRDEIDHWLAILNHRLSTGQTGAVWQRAWVAKYGKDFEGLVKAYRERQQSDEPVSQWDLR
jgi:hypothetical protein